jgi:hypothetical protein
VPLENVGVATQASCAELLLNNQPQASRSTLDIPVDDQGLQALLQELGLTYPQFRAMIALKAMASL